MTLSWNNYANTSLNYDVIAESRLNQFNMKQKNAMHDLYKQEQAIIALVKVNRQIVALANDLDAYWRENDRH